MEYALNDTPLMQAIRSHSVDEVRRLANKSTLRETNQLGQTPLAIAVVVEDSELVRVLCDLGADPDGRLTDHSATPLMLAARLGAVEVARALVSAGANVNANGFTTALVEAVRGNRTEMVKMLLSIGADSNVVVAAGADRGRTPRQIAELERHSEIAALL